MRNATMSLSVAELAMIGLTDSLFFTNTHKPVMKITLQQSETQFSIKQINAGLLNVGYAEAGPSNGVPVILLHGWPYDIYSYADVAPLLASAGYRVIIPHW